MTRRTISMATRVGVFLDADGICHLCGLRIDAPKQRWEVEHVKPLSMGGEHRESNLAPALAIEHRAKSAAETTARAKADRLRRKHNGTWPQSKAKLRSVPFRRTRPEPAGASHDD